jgi:tellurite resistance protein
VDTSQILSIFLRGALGSRGRKRARRAANFLTGQRGFLTASTLLGAAGVAWGIYDSLKPGATGAVPTPGATGALGATGAVLPPPLPGGTAAPVTVTPPLAAEDRGLPLEVLRVVRLAVSAARADGALLPAERALILSYAREAGVEATVEGELAVSRPLAEIVGGVTDTQKKQDLYVLAYTIVRADEAVSGAERIYLAQLAHQLGLDAATTARLEHDTAAKIDAVPDVPEG